MVEVLTKVQTKLLEYLHNRKNLTATNEELRRGGFNSIGMALKGLIRMGLIQQKRSSATKWSVNLTDRGGVKAASLFLRPYQDGAPRKYVTVNGDDKPNLPATLPKSDWLEMDAVILPHSPLSVRTILSEALEAYQTVWECWLKLQHTSAAEKELARMKIAAIKDAKTVYGL